MIKKPCFKKNVRVSPRYHGCTEEQFNLLFIKQDGLCKICGTKLTTHGQEPSSATVDHCHSSLEIRGILCSLCNKGIGHFRDDVSILKNAIEYLNHHKNTSLWWRLYRKLK